MKTKLPWQEVVVYAILWFSSVAFATFKLHKEISSARQSEDEGWYQDKSDVEWSWLKHIMSYGINIDIYLLTYKLMSTNYSIVLLSNLHFLIFVHKEG